jgi:hypothetical protein
LPFLPNTVFPSAVLTLHVQTQCLLPNLLARQTGSAYFDEGSFAVFVSTWSVFGFNIPPPT